jgi:signal transduction histidine kinase
MFKEILHNIVRHSRASRVDITVEIAPREFQLRVRDNGIGFDEARARAGNGLKNLRRRAAELGGRIEIDSRPGQGTTVTLRAAIT